MEIDLFFQNFQKVQISKKEVNWKIQKIFSILNSINSKTSIYEKVSTSNRDAKNISLLLEDLGLTIGAKEIQNIIKKSSCETKKDYFIRNLKESFLMFIQNKKMIHQNNIAMLYRVINSDEQMKEKEQLYRTENDVVPYLQIHAKPNIIDFKNVNTMLDQLMNFANIQGKSEIETFLNMQIVFLQLLLISPFSKYNFLISKFVSLWYWNLNKNFSFPLPFGSYLETLKINEEELQKKIQFSLKAGDYTNFVIFVSDQFVKMLQTKKIVNEISNYLIEKKRIFMAEHEKNFIFSIIHFQIHEFDWKTLRKICQWKFSKQYIMNCLARLEKKYDLLSSKRLQNRKFFRKSRLLIHLINIFSEPNQINYAKE